MKIVFQGNTRDRTIILADADIMSYAFNIAEQLTYEEPKTYQEDVVNDHLS